MKLVTTIFLANTMIFIALLIYTLAIREFVLSALFAFMVVLSAIVLVHLVKGEIT